MSKNNEQMRGGFWRPLAQYLVSTDGRVKNAQTGELLQGYLHESAAGTYRRHKLRLHGRTVRIFTHRLVAILWGQPPIGIGIETPGNLGPNVAQVNHLDGDTLNNAADNLEWCTPAQNKAHAAYLQACRAADLLPKV